MHLTCAPLSVRSIPSGQQLAYFFSFLAAGGVFLLLSFTIFLPVIILSPSKFALSFTLGCLLVMAAFSALRGWKQYVAHMMSAERMPFSAGTHCHSVPQRGMIDPTHEHAQKNGASTWSKALDVRSG